MTQEIVFQIIAKVRRRKIYLYAYIGESTLDKFNRRHKITAGAYKSNYISSIHYTVFNHSD